MSPPIDHPTSRRLADHLLDGRETDPMAPELFDWLAGSRRFRAFAETHRDKIRKKLRTSSEPDARRDVRAELRIAQLLLADRRIDIGFEVYGARRAGPDFRVTFRGTSAFNLEVTRPRRAEGFGRALLAKLRQLPTSVPNAVLLAVDGEDASAIDVDGTIRAYRSRADARDDEVFRSVGLAGARAFHERCMRLGAVVAWCEGGAGDARAAVWTNPSARIAVPEQALRACLACLRAA